MGKEGARPSLSARLSWWYAASTFLLVSGATGFLYWALIKNFAQQNDSNLVKKAQDLTTLLRDSSRQMPTIRWEVEEEAGENSSLRLLSRVIARDGTMLVQSHNMSAELPPTVFPPPSQAESSKEVRLPNGKVFRVLARTVRQSAFCNGECNVQLGIELTSQEKLLAGYRTQLWITLGVGLLISIVVGHRIAKRGIRPVEHMGETVRHIKATAFDERIRLDELPSELSTLAEAFNETLDRLEEAFTRLSRFSSDIAHELRTPINNIRGELEVTLGRARSPNEYREVLGSALEECQRLSRLIDSLLFLARSEQPETQIRREQIDVRQELVALLEFYEAAANERGVAVSLHAEHGMTTELDRTLLQRAVGNLLENALRYTTQGGRITISAGKAAAELRISVSDDGIGISADHLPRVFDRFYRIDTARAKQDGGTGLGLPIVQTIAVLHGGRAEIESKLGAGTRVTLSFPTLAQPRPVEPAANTGT